MGGIERKRRELVEFVTPQLAPDEQIVGGIASASGPSRPWVLLIPFVGMALMFTRRIRAYGLVVTSERAILVRRSKIRPGRPQRIDVAAPLPDVSVAKVKEGSAYVVLNLKLADTPVRLFVAGAFAVDVPRTVQALTPDAVTARAMPRA